MAEVPEVKGTRIAGWKLRLVAWLATKPLTGRIIRSKMLGDLGFGRLRTTAPQDGSPLRIKQTLLRPQQGDRPEGRIGRIVSGRVAPAEGFKAPTVSDFAQAYRQGKTSPVSVAERILKAVEASESGDTPYRFFIAQSPEDLMAQAEASQQRF